MAKETEKRRIGACARQEGDRILEGTRQRVEDRVRRVRRGVRSLPDWGNGGKAGKYRPSLHGGDCLSPSRHSLQPVRSFPPTWRPAFFLSQACNLLPNAHVERRVLLLLSHHRISMLPFQGQRLDGSKTPGNRLLWSAVRVLPSCLYFPSVPWAFQASPAVQ